MHSTDTILPLVAVTTPVYNGGRFLADAMEAVQSQTYPNLVHVVLDNASTDNTPEIIARFKGRRVPIITARNPALLPLQRNWSRAVALVPASAKYFQILCADDLIAPDTVAKMTAVAESDPGVELVGCMQRLNGRVLPTSLREDCTVFDGASIARAYLNKESNDIPHMFGLFRRRDEDFKSDFFDHTIWANDTDACLRAMTRGKFGFVHEPLFNQLEHESQISKTLAKKNQSRVFEPLILIERWGSRIMTKAEYKTCRARHLRAIYRYMLLWRLTGGTDMYNKYLGLLNERSKAPGIQDFALSALEWPLHLVDKVSRKAMRYGKLARGHAR